jgi:hypothetical protein
MRTIRRLSLLVTLMGGLALLSPADANATVNESCGVCNPAPSAPCPTSGEMEAMCSTFCGGYSYAPFCSESPMCAYGGRDTGPMIMCSGYVE